MKALRSVSLVIALGIGAALFAAPPNGYYNSLEGLSGVSLKKAAKTVAKKNHSAIPYGDSTWEAFKTTDVHTVGGVLVWWDMYSNNLVSVSSGHGGLNIEHSVANSWWGGTKNNAYKDLFHLNPSNSEANNRKGNYPLGEIKTGTWDNGVTFVGKPANGDCGGATYVYEPADEYKGDFARAFFYMFTVYDDISWTSNWNWMYDTSSDLLLKPWAYELLLKWSRQDPVSQKEIDRNEAISKKQGNRNPFIDCPSLAEHIWGPKKSEAFHYDEEYDPSDPGTDPGDGDDDQPGQDPGTDPVPPGYWYAVSTVADLNETDRYVVVAVDKKVVMASTNAGKYMTICSQLATIDRSQGVDRLATVPSDAAVVTLTKAGAGYIMGVSNTSGEFQGYMNSTTAKTLTLVQTGGSVVTVTPSPEATTLSFGKAGKLLYNVSAPRFLTYTSDQNPVMLYRLQEEKSAGVATAIDGSEAPVLIGIYDINGRKIDAVSTDDLDHGIYIVVTNYGAKKVVK